MSSGANKPLFLTDISVQRYMCAEQMSSPSPRVQHQGKKDQGLKGGRAGEREESSSTQGCCRRRMHNFEPEAALLSASQCQTPHSKIPKIEGAQDAPVIHRLMGGVESSASRRSPLHRIPSSAARLRLPNPRIRRFPTSEPQGLTRFILGNRAQLPLSNQPDYGSIERESPPHGPVPLGAIRPPSYQPQGPPHGPSRHIVGPDPWTAVVEPVVVRGLAVS